MVFGFQKLQDQLFCVTEERDYFQGKYMEQVSEIAALKEELLKAKREISRLRGQLMETSQSQLTMVDGAITPPVSRRRRGSSNNSWNGSQNSDTAQEDVDANAAEAARQTHDQQDDTESLSYDDDHQSDDDEVDDEHQERKEIRQSAEKLLQWATYRTSYAQRNSLSPGSSIASPRNLAMEDDEEKKEETIANSVPRDVHTSSVLPSASHDSADTMPTSHPASPPETPHVVSPSRS